MVSLLTALIIQGNDTNVDPYQGSGSNHWGYEVSRMERGNHRPLVTCPAIYGSEEIAQRKGDELVRSIRKLDLAPHREGLGEILGDAKEAVQSVIDASK